MNTTQDTKDADLMDKVPADSNGLISLRAAIMHANQVGGAHTIELGAETYTLTIEGDREDDGATGDLDISSDITLIGEQSGYTVIDAGGIDRAIDIHGGADVGIYGLTIRNGHADSSGFGESDGGGIYLNRPLKK